MAVYIYIYVYMYTHGYTASSSCGRSEGQASAHSLVVEHGMYRLSASLGKERLHRPGCQPCN